MAVIDIGSYNTAGYMGGTMFIFNMFCDGPKTEAAHPTWAEIEAAIRQLDGLHRTEVSLGGNGEAHMSVTGGGGIYAVYATLNNDVFYELRNPNGSPEERVKFVSGGQRVSVRGNEVVLLATALTAAKTFAERGEFDDRLTWHKNPS